MVSWLSSPARELWTRKTPLSAGIWPSAPTSLGLFVCRITPSSGTAGTEVTSDIIFLQKRDHITDLDQDWVHLDTDENGIRMNRYFVQHPEMILWWTWVMESTRFGPDSACKAREGGRFIPTACQCHPVFAGGNQALRAGGTGRGGRSLHPRRPQRLKTSATPWWTARCTTGKTVSCTPVEVSVTAENRIRGMIELRECCPQAH